MTSVGILEGDALVRLAELPADSIGSIVTDPPYGLEFMSVAWDTFGDGRKGGQRVPNTWGDHGSREHPRNAYEAGHVRGKKSRAFEEFCRVWAIEAYRVLKPGGHVVAFGGTRTFHRLTCAIEDAGFEIRDCLMWLYGQGFPKGKGCLKPGWEPIILARKPAPAPWLNVDGCRIESGPRPLIENAGRKDPANAFGSGKTGSRNLGETTPGRWPANVVLSHEDGCRDLGAKRVRGTNRPGPAATTNGKKYGQFGAQPAFDYANADGTETVSAWECVPECAVRLLDEQSGERPSRAWNGHRNTPKTQNTFGDFALQNEIGKTGDTGGASRFFYCAKASPSERGAFNDHPTVKPLALMQWICRLVTPTGGTVLDPFCGSGSTLVAAHREGFDVIGIDSDPHAVEIATRRMQEAAGPLLAPIEVSA